MTLDDRTKAIMLAWGTKANDATDAELAAMVEAGLCRAIDMHDAAGKPEKWHVLTPEGEKVRAEVKEQAWDEIL